MCKIVGFGENLEKFAACRASKLDNRGKFFGFVQSVTFWQQANITIPQELGVFAPVKP